MNRMEEPDALEDNQDPFRDLPIIETITVNQ